MTVRPRRFTASLPCPVCGGHDGLTRGEGIRCFGYLDSRGRYARCTREEHAGNLPENRDGTYSHRLHGHCPCGQAHGEESHAGEARPVAPGILRRRAEQRFRSFFTLTAYLRRRYGRNASIRFWPYHDAEGREIFRVLRIDYAAPDGTKAKSYRPCHVAGDGRWLISRPPEKLPLYRLPEILAAPPEAVITVLEGEKCADIAASLGLTPASASAHGAQAPWLTDWSPLSGRRVAILADAGKAGASYATQVTALIAALEPPAIARIVTLPGLADGEDIEQFAADLRQSGHSDEAILETLQASIIP